MSKGKSRGLFEISLITETSHNGNVEILKDALGGFGIEERRIVECKTIGKSKQ